MSSHHKSATMKFGVPLAWGSRNVERCYAKHGKACGMVPSRDTPLEVILLNSDRHLLTVAGFCPQDHQFRTEAVACDSGWRILGWRVADGSMPLGHYDEVDPALHAARSR